MYFQGKILLKMPETSLYYVTTTMFWQPKMVAVYIQQHIYIYI